MDVMWGSQHQRDQVPGLARPPSWTGPGIGNQQVGRPALTDRPFGDSIPVVRSASPGTPRTTRSDALAWAKPCEGTRGVRAKEVFPKQTLGYSGCFLPGRNIMDGEY